MGISINHLPDVSSSGKHENLRLKQIKTGSLFHRMLDSEPNYELHPLHPPPPQKKNSPYSRAKSFPSTWMYTLYVNFFSNFIYNSISVRG